MSTPFSTYFFAALLLFLMPNAYAVTEEVSKSQCKSVLGYSDIEVFKRDAVSTAKRLAVNELFGELISSFTAVENFTVTEDIIKLSSAGLIRIKGDLQFYNGDNLAEVCVSFLAYATDEDRRKFEPFPLVKKHCLSDSKLTTRQLIEKTKEQTILNALHEYDRRLRYRKSKIVLPLLHQITYLENGFVPETETYCSKVQGLIYPIEVLAVVTAVEVESNEAASRQDQVTVKQWVKEVVSYSSQFDSSGWAAKQVVGAPTINRCGDLKGSWAAAASGGGVNFVEVAFAQSVYPSKLMVRQNNEVGFVTKLEFWNDQGQSFPMDVTDHLSECPGDSVFDVKGKIDFPTKRVKVYVDSNHGAGFEEIDAISIEGYLPN